MGPFKLPELRFMILCAAGVRQAAGAGSLEFPQLC